MTMKIKLDGGAWMPDRAFDEDAGLDIMAMNDEVVPAHDSVLFDTGVHVELPQNTCGMLVSKSGLLCKHGIMSTGLIDEGYTGSIKVKLFNFSNEDYEVKYGDKISQLVIIPVIKPYLSIVKDLEETDRGNNGLGSTGR